MRVVRRPEDLDAAMAPTRSEAERAFGDGALLIERYIEDARHVEIQIFGDHHGNDVHLFERDCSVQRRHQKIIEESPSPAVMPELSAALCEAAVKLGRMLGYTNAGTVEFLVAPSGDFYFIEVNTRIQVEHTVTEMVTGLDLIQLQIEVAEGRELRLDHVQHRGHAWLAPDHPRLEAGHWRSHRFGVRKDPGSLLFTTCCSASRSYGRRLETQPSGNLCAPCDRRRWAESRPIVSS